MKDQRFKPSPTKHNGGCKEKHKVTVTRKLDDERWEKAGKAYDKWGFRLLLAFKLYSYAEPYTLDFLALLQQLM